MPMTPMEDDEFTTFLRGKAMEAQIALNYRPALFLQMLGSSGGYQTVSSLISQPKPSDGFTKLWEGGRLDLSVEALVTESRWRRCFDANLLVAAEMRLSKAGYVVALPEQPDTTPFYGELTTSQKVLPAIQKFVLGEEYTRSDVFKMLDLYPEPKGGGWFTGYAEHEGNAYLFCNVGIPGRTGHDYKNYFDGDRMVWSGKGPSKLQHASIQSLLKPQGRSYIFYRLSDRGPFTFAGIAKPYQVFDTSPVEVIWEFYDRHSLKSDIDSFLRPSNHGTVVEGGAKSVTIKIYERDRGARLKCIQHWGWKCFVCQFDFAKTYGELGEGFIHVHHLKPLAEIGDAYDLNPVTDLRPVCPNCHAMLHRKVPALAIEELKVRINQAKGH
ncbi:HNH endonuclease [Pseudomonas azerbaijanoccidens]|uniref:HNH endonuclease n=1 Tax=Pseudomonas azerbaijanoccidentalis TaxID=2842347 RepID=UPI00200B308C|nr:HNH endonuclease [Pseudomonas azerbaijanoccidentalis]MCK8668213.1 HNH endonuclease [Pseudomonas azerbaijanoccidentalis]